MNTRADWTADIRAAMRGLKVRRRIVDMGRRASYLRKTLDMLKQREPAKLADADRITMLNRGRVSSVNRRTLPVRFARSDGTQVIAYGIDPRTISR